MHFLTLARLSLCVSSFIIQIDKITNPHYTFLSIRYGNLLPQYEAVIILAKIYISS